MFLQGWGLDSGKTLFKNMTSLCPYFSGLMGLFFKNVLFQIKLCHFETRVTDMIKSNETYVKKFVF